MNITKKIISKEISDLTNFNLKQSSDFTNKFFEIIKKKIESHNVKINKFGTFSKVATPRRVGRNPNNKKEYIINKRDRIKFQNSGVIKNILN